MSRRSKTEPETGEMTGSSGTCPDTGKEEKEKDDKWEGGREV